MRAKTERRRNAEPLRRVSLFADCSDRELMRIDGLLTEMTVAAGRMLMGRGTASLQFMFVSDGYGRVSADGEDIGRVGPGSYVGEHTFRGQLWNATITALTPMTVYVLHAGELATLMEDIPSIRKRIARQAEREMEPRRLPQAGLARA